MNNTTLRNYKMNHFEINLTLSVAILLLDTRTSGCLETPFRMENTLRLLIEKAFTASPAAAKQQERMRTTRMILVFKKSMSSTTNS
jgi:hypothetical protein